MNLKSTSKIDALWISKPYVSQKKRLVAVHKFSCRPSTSAKSNQTLKTSFKFYGREKLKKERNKASKTRSFLEIEKSTKICWKIVSKQKAMKIQMQKSKEQLHQIMASITISCEERQMFAWEMRPNARSCWRRLQRLWGSSPKSAG